MAALLPEEKRKELEKHIVKKKLATHLSQVQQNQSAGQLTPSQSDGNIAALQTQDRVRVCVGCMNVTLRLSSKNGPSLFRGVS